MNYALNEGKYPIETADQVKAAAAFFDENIKRFAPVDRVDIAHNLEKRAFDLGVDLGLEWVPNYSRMMKKNASYSPDFEQNVELRKQACVTGRIKVKCDGKEVVASKLLEKLAAQKEEVTPLNMVSALAEFDKMANLEYHYDGRLMDPVFTVYGSLNDPQYDFVKLAEGLTDYDLKKAVVKKQVMTKLASTFGAEFVKDFKNNPVEVFDSMPAPEKELIVNTINS